MRLELTADLEALSGIREFVTSAMTALAVDTRVHDDIRLAVDEAVTNVLIHGYGGSGSVAVEVLADGKDLVVLLSDVAPPFDPTTFTEIDLTLPGERDNPGGLGLFLIRQSMDDIEYRYLAGRNELRLVKRGVVDPSDVVAQS